MPTRRTGWIGGALAVGFAVVLAPPMLLFWNAIQPEPWNSNMLKIRFQNVRFEAGGLVFRYSVQNLTHHTARFLPDATQVRALQPADRPPVGYANIKLPLELPAESVQQVELRLELPGNRLSMRREQSDDEQTKMVLQHQPPGSPPATDSPLSPLPMRGKIAANENQRPAQPNFSFEDSLSDLQGFELADPARGIKLVFPRGW
jgi:hypothetical protein